MAICDFHAINKAPLKGELVVASFLPIFNIFKL